MQPGVLPLQILYPRIQGLRLRTPLPRLQLSLRRLLALAAPEDQVGRIEALAPQQGPDFTRPLAGIGFPHDPQLVLRRESPPLRPRYHLGIGHILPRARRPALDHGGPSAPRRLASLAAAPLRVPHGRLLNAQRQVLDQAPFASPPCTLNSRGSAVSRIFARRDDPICRGDVLAEAWERVKSSRGAAGDLLPERWSSLTDTPPGV